ncbi:DnaD domain protein [Paenilisteria newyorkensis]|uniref:DnaD domain protein n=1 Tax=Listeria newyorkensis TaxID=1497681 RepID=UPI000669F2CB|nr:DnaD domain protein [Listeria newyorkensis]KMT62689.1 hypothetical protein X559_0972 [Listeria newyorkensis]
MSDSLKIQGIYAQGYGMIAKTVMRDKELSIEAKSIYSYLASFAGAGSTAFPTIELMLGELNISRDRFYKHRKQLVEKGYIKIIQSKGEKGLQKKNVYEIVNNPEPEEPENPQSQNKATDDEPQSSYPESCYPTAENKESDNKDGISNSLIINNLINNNTNNNSNTEAAAANSVNNIFSVDELIKSAAANPFSTFHQNIGEMNAIQTDNMMYWVYETQDADFVNYAVERAALRGAYNYGFVDKLLTEWTNAKIKNKEQAKAYEMQREKKVGGGYRGKQPDERAGRYQSKARYKPKT